MSIPAVFPVYRYANAPETMAWLGRAFGFTVQADYRTPDGLVAHAELRRGATVFGISSRTPVTKDNPWSEVRSGVYVRVDDADAAYARARAAGADVAIALRDTSYGSREFSLRDHEGRLWSLGTYAMGASAGTPDLFVGLRYDDGRRAMAWLEKALGFEPGLSVDCGSGRTEHAEEWLADDTVMISGAGPSQGLWNGDRDCIYGWIADPDAHCAQAASAGARIVQQPADTPYGARGYYARDPESLLWGFSTYRPKKQQ